jgi:probable blue pigment (indigoidine) exporter
MFRSSCAHSSSLSLIAAAACWGVAAVISKRAVDEIDPLTLLPIELAVSVTVLSVATMVTQERVRWSPQMRCLGLLGVLNPGVSYALSLAGLAHLTASVSVLLWAIEPILILALAYLVLKERITISTAMCAATALLGVGLVVFQPGNRATGLGIALTIAGVGACAIYTVLSSKYLTDASTLGVVLVQQAAALGFAVMLFAASFVFGNPNSVADVSGEAWASALAAGVLYYGLAFWFYITGLKGMTAGRAGLFINLVPVFGIAAGYLALDERLFGRQWIGAAVIIASIVLVSIRQTRGERPTRAHRDSR